MTINTLPTAPLRTMSPADFVAAANTFLAALPTFSSQVNADLSALLTLSQLVSTSTTSLTIGTGSKSLTVQTSKAYLANQAVRIYSTATPDNYMDGTVTSYDSGTGALVVNVTATNGSGTLTAWTVILNGGLATSVDLNAAVALRALLAGSASQVFSVAAATAAAHAMRLDTPNRASIAVTQTGGALTFAGVAHPLTFRSATLTDGTVSVAVIADPADLVLPSGGTLGFTSGVQGRILVAEINNAGTSEYAICNNFGGLQMDETNLISTTAIGTGSDSANVWYSTSARSNLPYKIVAAVDVVNTGGAWGDPVLVQPGTAADFMLKHATSVYNSASVTMTTANTYYKMTVNTAIGTNTGIADTANSRVLINKPGRYYIEGECEILQATAAGTSRAAIYKNGTIARLGTAVAANTTYVANPDCFVVLDLAPGDYIELYAVNNQNGCTAQTPGCQLTVFEL